MYAIQKQHLFVSQLEKNHDVRKDNYIIKSLKSVKRYSVFSNVIKKQHDCPIKKMWGQWDNPWKK